MYVTFMCVRIRVFIAYMVRLIGIYMWYNFMDLNNIKKSHILKKMLYGSLKKWETDIHWYLK